MGRVQDPAQDALESLITSRLHKSWIADVQLLPPVASSVQKASDLPWLLTACNDGSITLWDPARVDAAGRFEELGSTCGAHTKGIFSMHVRPFGGEAVGLSSFDTLTSSKDSSVALTTVHATGMQTVQRWEDLHCGTIKSVRWRDSSVAATAGNDRWGTA